MLGQKTRDVLSLNTLKSYWLFNVHAIEGHMSGSQEMAFDCLYPPLM